MEDIKSRVQIGRIGFWLALAPWVVSILTTGCAIARIPGFG